MQRYRTGCRHDDLVDPCEHGRISGTAGRLAMAGELLIDSQIVGVGAIAGQILGLGEPGYRLFKPLAEAVDAAKDGRPSEQPLRLAVAGPQAVDLAALRTQPHASCSISILASIRSAIVRAVSPIEISNPLPILMTSPMPAVAERGEKPPPCRT